MSVISACGSLRRSRRMAVKPAKPAPTMVISAMSSVSPAQLCFTVRAHRTILACQIPPLGYVEMGCLSTAIGGISRTISQARGDIVRSSELARPTLRPFCVFSLPTITELRAGQPEKTRGSREIAACALHSLFDEFTLQGFERQTTGDQFIHE